MASERVASKAPGNAEWPGEADGQRDFERWNPFAISLTVNGREHEALVRDISPTGARIQLAPAAEFEAGEDVVLNVEGYGELKANIRRLLEGDIAIEFTMSHIDSKLFGYWLQALRLEKKLLSDNPGG